MTLDGLNKAEERLNNYYNSQTTIKNNASKRMVLPKSKPYEMIYEITTKLMQTVCHDTELNQLFRLNQPQDDESIAFDRTAYLDKFKPKLIESMSAIFSSQLNAEEQAKIKIYLTRDANNTDFLSAYKFVLESKQDKIVLLSRYINYYIPDCLSKKLGVDYKLNPKTDVAVLIPKTNVTDLGSLKNHHEAVLLTMMAHMRSTSST